jgi:hypothetical protein
VNPYLNPYGKTSCHERDEFGVVREYGSTEPVPRPLPRRGTGWVENSKIGQGAEQAGQPVPGRRARKQQ